MKATLNKRFLLIVRTESDKPIVEQPYPRPKNITPTIFNSWRSDYRMSFDTEDEAERALVKVTQIDDFDAAAAWLDKQ